MYRQPMLNPGDVSMKELMVIVGAIVVLAAIILSPLAVIWSVNTLFKTGIEYTFVNWLAMLVLQGALTVRYSNSSKK